MTDFISKVLPGLGGMLNIHPLLVHFPIALLSAFLITDLFGFLLKKEKLKHSASVMLYIGAVGAMATVASGLMAANKVPHAEEVHFIMQRHKYFGITVLVISLFLSIWRYLLEETFSKTGQVIHFTLSILMVGVMSMGADLGGMMVYRYGVAVSAVPQEQGHNHSESRHEPKSDEAEDIPKNNDHEHTSAHEH